jgi:hypothetical protein
MRRPWALACLLVLVPRAVEAGVVEYHLEGSVSAGGTDNALAVPAGAPGAHADAFVLARAAVAVSRSSPNTEHRLQYEFSGQQQAREAQGRMLSHQLTWRLLTTPSADLLLDLRAELHYGRTSSALVQLPRLEADPAPQGQPSSSAQPGEPLTVLSGQASALARYVWPRWHLEVGSGVRGLVPGDDERGPPRGYDVEGWTGFAHTRSLDQIGLGVRAGYHHSGDISPAGVLFPAHAATRGEALLTWHHEFFAALTSQLEGGVLVIRTLDRTLTEPTARGALAYAHEGDELRLEAGRDATPNLLVGETLLADQAALTAGLRTGRWGQWRLTARAGYERDHFAAGGLTDSAAATVLTGRAGAGYQIGRGVALTLEYGYTDQRSAGPPLEPGQYRPLASFRRSVLMLTLDLDYPAEERP